MGRWQQQKRKLVYKLDMKLEITGNRTINDAVIVPGDQSKCRLIFMTR
jgi:hypothetical protein